MRPACARLFEVEALRDGRLTGAERASFERHLATCTSCSREAQSLEALAHAARSAGDGAAPADELHVRRQRAHLLAAFDAGLVGGGRRPRRFVWPALVLALALVAALFAVLRARPAHGPSAPTASGAMGTAPPTASSEAPPTLEIQANGQARYAKRTEGQRERIVLESGELRVRVVHARASGEPGVLVTMPDGELEDTGTIFRVAVALGHTTQVTVEEGSVMLRLGGRAAISLRAKETWSADAPPAAAEPPPRAPPSSRAAAPLPGVVDAEAPTPPPLADDASKEFRDAMSALNAGQAGDAAARFQRFLDAHPTDSRAEDAAYMRVVALQRAGDDAAMQEAARRYLTRFPAGFRRAEVERLARPR